MKLFIILLYLVSLSFSSVWCALHPISPCPSIFSYEGSEPEGDRWYGEVTINSRELLVGVILKIQLDRKAHLMVSWLGETTTTDNKEFTILNLDQKLDPSFPLSTRIMVRFDSAGGSPQVRTIWLNGKQICPTEPPIQANALNHLHKKNDSMLKRPDPIFSSDTLYHPSITTYDDYYHEFFSVKPNQYKPSDQQNGGGYQQPNQVPQQNKKPPTKQTYDHQQGTSHSEGQQSHQERPISETSQIHRERPGNERPNENSNMKPAVSDYEYSHTTAKPKPTTTKPAYYENQDVPQYQKPSRPQNSYGSSDSTYNANGRPDDTFEYNANSDSSYLPNGNSNSRPQSPVYNTDSNMNSRPSSNSDNGFGTNSRPQRVDEYSEHKPSQNIDYTNSRPSENTYNSRPLTSATNYDPDPRPQSNAYDINRPDPSFEYNAPRPQKVPETNSNSRPQIPSVVNPTRNENAGSATLTDCWWTDTCQKFDWQIQGCGQYDRIEKARKSCDDGFLYECCKGGNTQYSTLYNSSGPYLMECWWTDTCQKFTWSKQGCGQYNRVEKARRSCDNGKGYLYECCKGDHIQYSSFRNSVKLPLTDCGWTDQCQKFNWDLQGCGQYNRIEKARKPCDYGFLYECCNLGGQTNHNDNQKQRPSGQSSNQGIADFINTNTEIIDDANKTVIITVIKHNSQDQTTTESYKTTTQRQKPTSKPNNNQDNNNGGNSNKGQGQPLNTNQQGQRKPQDNKKPTYNNNNNNREKYDCGKVAINKATPLVTYGQKTARGQWPWHAALYKTEGINLSYMCGGSLISSNFVVTAAHCVTKKPYDKPVDSDTLVIYLGKYHQHQFSDEGGVQNKQVLKIHVYPSYNSSNYLGDLALLQLSSDADYSTYVRPVCLWDDSIAPLTLSAVEGKDGTVIGWGYDENDRVSEELKMAIMPIVSQQQCLWSNPQFFSQFTSDHTFCAGFRNGTSVCNGDSGGGMVFSMGSSWYLRGVVSLTVARDGLKTCDTKHYVVFTDVAKYLQWIRPIIL